MKRVASSVTLRQTAGYRDGRSFAGGGGVPSYVWGIAGGSAVVLGGAYFAFVDEVPISHRRRWIATSPEWESQMGDREYQQLLHQYKTDILPQNHRASLTLCRVGQPIAEASSEFAKRNKIAWYVDKPYTYTVIRSDVANAFVLPGNHVFLMTGLFRYVRDEDELAMILGHEVAHNLARHAGEKISGSIVAAIFARLSLWIDPSGALFTILLPALSVFRQLPNSRIQEIEADEIGLQLATEACYDPRAAKRVFSAMLHNSDRDDGLSSPPEFLSTHPSHVTRIQNFDKWTPDALTSFGKDYDKRCSRIRQQMSQARQAAAVAADRRGD